MLFLKYGDAALDGQNKLKFYWIDLLDSARRQLEDPAFAGKLYHQFEQEDDGFGNRIFEKANSGLVFESFQTIDMESAPALIIVASNAAHKGNVVFRPMYCKLLFHVPSFCFIYMCVFQHAYST